MAEITLKMCHPGEEVCCATGISEKRKQEHLCFSPKYISAVEATETEEGPEIQSETCIQFLRAFQVQKGNWKATAALSLAETCLDSLNFPQR